MLERYWVWERDLWGHNPKRPDSTKKEKTIEMVKAADAQATMADLQGQAKDYQACRDALDRTVLELKQAQQRVAQLESGCEVCRKRYDNLSTQYSTLQADHATLLGFIEELKGDFHLGEVQKARDEANSFEAQGDMYGWNFHQGRGSGFVGATLLVRNIMRKHGIDPNYRQSLPAQGGV